MIQRGFTVVEMLVCIAILGVLMGLVLPVLAGVHAAARQVQCQANLRQMAFAATTYATRWDAFPAAIRYEEGDGAWHRIAWDWVTTWDGEVVSPGPLWELTDNPDRVMQCPSFHGPSNFEGDPYTGYNYNTSYLGGEAQAVVAGWETVRPGVPWRECRRTSSTAIFGCGGYAAGANKFMRAPSNPEMHPLSVTYAGGQAFRHSGATSIAFIDGHVGSSEQAHKGVHATPELLEIVMYFPRHGFLSDDDRAYDPR
jgi:prepilin-type N-terminal cleavage/methylation domain-containing protein/prepilin-type processing-associated H-X9-DG protein